MRVVMAMFWLLVVAWIVTGKEPVRAAPPKVVKNVPLTRPIRAHLMSVDPGVLSPVAT